MEIFELLSLFGQFMIGSVISSPGARLSRELYRRGRSGLKLKGLFQSVKLGSDRDLGICTNGISSHEVNPQKRDSS